MQHERGESNAYMLMVGKAVERENYEDQDVDMWIILRRI
jgi:hypothetical protein